MDTRDLNDYEGGLRNWLRVTYFKFAHFLANKWAYGQTAITPKMAELVDIPESKLLGIWPSGVERNRFSPALKGRKWPDGDESVRLIYTGKLHAERKLLPLCQAVVKANQHGMSFIFTLLGDGLERSVLESFAEQSGGAIVVEPPVPYGEVPDFLHRAHVGVTPLPASDDPKFESSSPIKMFEYMAAGLPILSTRNVCHTSVVQDKNYAFWADDGELDDLYLALVMIWEDRKNLMEKGLEAAREAINWTWEASGSILSNALERCLREAQLENVTLDPKKADTHI
jgi:glycosyltransferase involved in cell wall biosynthesis